MVGISCIGNGWRTHLKNDVDILSFFLSLRRSREHVLNPYQLRRHTKLLGLLDLLCYNLAMYTSRDEKLWWMGQHDYEGK